MPLQKTTQSTTKLPTVQDRKEALAQKLGEIKESVTPDMIEKAAKKAGVTPRTAREYIKGSVAFLHRGEVLYNTLMKELKGIAA